MHTGGHCLFFVENAKPLDLHLLKSKSVPFVWEFMFTSSITGRQTWPIKGSFSMKSPH